VEIQSCYRCKTRITAGENILKMLNKYRKSSSAKTVVVMLLVCCFLLSCKRLSNDPLANWEAITVEPAENAVILQQAAESPCVWKVGIDARTHHFKIETTANVLPKQGKEVRLQIGAGTLVGTNGGEYGGGLSLVDSDGTSAKSLLTENVIQLLPLNSGALVFTGILHLGEDKGAVWSYSKAGDHDWSIKKLADLDGSPRAIYSGDREVLAVTGHGVSQIGQTLNLTKIASLPFAQTLPNSISEDAQKRIYIGMNGLVVRLTQTKAGYKHEWFTKSGCLR